MSGALSKRQQARNERALQDLIKSVPGNNVCADCQARNPGWASWSLGIFLCMRCAALHRKIGTHITKVKSLSMDSWSNDQVENMKRVGNMASNRTYNPNNEKPPIPFDADEADSAMERFIRGKYQERAAAARPQTGRSSGSDDHPPPLPPKNGSKFGFRSASSIFPLSSKSRRGPPAPVDIPRRRSPSPMKNSRDFGSSIASGPMDLAGKMQRLRDMGFMDDKRNLAILNGLGGNVEKTIDTLVRLGEGNGNVAGDSSSSRGSRTPNTPKFPLSPGLAVNRSRDRPTPEAKSTNPFDLLDAPPPIAQPQSSQSTGSKPHPLSQPALNNPFLQAPQQSTTNPFGLTPSQSQFNLNQMFQGMSVTDAQPTQPLFPNHTGGFPATQPSQHQQMYQQSMTPPVPSVPQQYFQSAVYQQSQQQPQDNMSYNPFMQQQSQQQPNLPPNSQNNLYTQQQQIPQNVYQSPVEMNTQQQFPMSIYDNGVQQPQTNPFFAQNNNQAQAQSQFQQSNQPQTQGQFQQPNQTQTQGQFQQPNQPQTQGQFQQPNSQAQAQVQYQQSYTQAQQQPQQFQQPVRQDTYPMMTQQAPRADNRSIMDLYNYPQLAPSRPQMQENQPVQEQTPTQNFNAPQQPLSQQQPQQRPHPNPQQQFQQRSVSSPLGAMSAGSRNPFNTGIGGAPAGVQQQATSGVDTLGSMGQFAPQQQKGSRHVSQESMSVDAGGWQNGRHSPDAWGTISARSIR